MNAKRIVLAACAALSLTACGIGKPIPQATTYAVDPPPAAVFPERRPQTLRVGNVRVAAAYAGSALVYRVDDVQYLSDPYHAFIAEPAGMLANRMAVWLEQSGPFEAVAQPGGTRAAPYVLEATVAELYGDFRAGRQPAAVVAVQFALIDQTGTRPILVTQRTISTRVDLPRASPDALVRGYGTALAEILTRLASELDASLPGASRS